MERRWLGLFVIACGTAVLIFVAPHVGGEARHLNWPDPLPAVLVVAATLTGLVIIAVGLWRLLFGK